jgi:hypothetical protein
MSKVLSSFCSFLNSVNYLPLVSDRWFLNSVNFDPDNLAGFAPANLRKPKASVDSGKAMKKNRI